MHEIGDAVGLSPSAVQRRLARYKASGIVTRQVAVLNPDAVPGTVVASILVTLERESTDLHKSFRQRLLATPEVQQCYDLAGERDYLIIIAAHGLPRCRAVIDDLFMDAPNVQRYTTHFVLEVVKADLAIPVA